MTLNIIKNKKNFILRFYRKNKLIFEKAINNLEEIKDINLDYNNYVKKITLDYYFMICFNNIYPILNRRRLTKEQQELTESIYNSKYIIIDNKLKKNKNNIIVYSTLMKKTLYDLLNEKYNCPISFINYKFKNKGLHFFIDDNNIVFRDGNVIVLNFDNSGYEKIIKHLYFLNYEGYLSLYVSKNSLINIEEVRKTITNELEDKVTLNIEYC